MPVGARGAYTRGVATLERPGPAPSGPGFAWRAGSPILALLVAVALSVPLFAALDAGPLSEDAEIAVGGFVFGLVLALLALGLLWMLPAHDRRVALATKGGLPQSIGIGVGVGFLIAFGAALIAAFGVAADSGVSEDLEEIAPEIGTAGWQIGLTVVALVALAPLGEELLFRALLLRALVRRLGFWLSALASGALFALAHGAAFLVWPRAIGLVLTGVALAWLYRERGYWTAVSAHATVNGIAAVALLLAPEA